MPSAERHAVVTFSAVVQRLNRKLEKEKKAIRSPRGRADRSILGDYFFVDTRRDAIIDTKVTPAKIEEMARERGVLANWEEVR